MQDVLPQRAAVLGDLIAQADSFERSWSIGANGTVEKRHLLFFDQVDQRADLIAKTAMALGMSPQTIQEWQKQLGDADAIGLAFNSDSTSVRLYAQYWDRLVHRVNAGDFSPYPLYLGLKSLPNGQMREDVYICHPQAAQSMFLPVIGDAMARIGIRNLTGLSEKLTAEACIFTTISGGGRNSFLATVRRADLAPQVVAQWLAQLPATPWADEMRAQPSELLHIAGGEDPLKGAFTTLYFSCSAADL